MTHTLKTRHTQRQLRALHEQVKNVDKQLVLEQRTSTMLLEAMNKDDLDKVTAIIQKLSKIKSPGLPKLTAAIEQAEAEVNKYTSGGPLVKAWSKIKGLAGVDNPIVRVMTFANALETGFSQIPTILKNNGVDLTNVDLDKSLAAILSGASDAGGATTTADASNTTAPANTGAATPTQTEAANGPQKKLQSIADQLRKALSPSGIYGVFKKVPYINGQELAKELLAAPLKAFSATAKKIAAGAKSADVAPDLKSQIATGGQEQTTNAKVVDPTKPSQQTQQSQPAKPTTATTGTKPPGEHPNTPPGTTRGGGTAPVSDAKKSAFKALKDTDIFRKLKLNDASAEAFIAALDDHGYLKNPD